MITNFPRDDGFGAQFQTILFSIIYSDLVGGSFAYTPFSSIAHNYNNDPNFVSDKEKLIGALDLFPLSTESDIKTSGLIYQIVEDNLFQLSRCSQFQAIKSAFHVRNVYPYDVSKYNIAVHFRNINKEDIGDYGFTPLSYFAKKIESLRSDNVVFHFFSQGNIDEFSSVQFPDVVFHLNESVEDTFCGLVFADELVMSKSSFSYCAALLSNGSIHYQPFWHKPAPHWIF